MIRFAYRARWAVTAAVVALGPLVLSGCDFKQSLVGLQQPALISPSSVAGPTGAQALYVGVIGKLKADMSMGGNNAANVLMIGDLLVDEWKTGNTFVQDNNADARTEPTNDSLLESYYDATQRVRGFAVTARQALQAATPTATAEIGEMFWAQSFPELMLAEDWCNGIPLSGFVNGQAQYSAPLTDAQVLAVVAAQMDTARGIVTGTDAASLAIHYLLETTEARAYVDVGNYTKAITLTADVPTSFQYVFGFDATTGDNQLWNYTTSSKRYVVSDSFDFLGGIGGAENFPLNSLPFASAKDPRVPVTGSTSQKSPVAIDGITASVENVFYGTRDESYPVMTGIDARLIEGEAQLNAGNYVGMMATLNTLRTNPQKLGINPVAAMPALTTVPTTASAAIAIFFREKAFWQFARGYRLGDERRMVRIYGMPQASVYPSGVFFKGGNYGTEVVLPVTDDEKTNPLFTGCLDMNA